MQAFLLILHASHHKIRFACLLLSPAVQQLLIPLSILFTASLALQGVVIAAIENRGSAVPASLALMLAVRPSDERNHAGHRRIGRTRSGTSVERAGRELRGAGDGCCINGFVAFADIFVRTDSAG